MESGSLLTAALDLWRGSALRSNAVEQDAGGFVGGVLWHQFAFEGLDQHRLIEVIDQLVGAVGIACEC